MLCSDPFSLDLSGKSQANLPHVYWSVLHQPTGIRQGAPYSASSPGNCTDFSGTLGRGQKDFKQPETPCHVSFGLVLLQWSRSSVANVLTLNVGHGRQVESWSRAE